MICGTGPPQYVLAQLRTVVFVTPGYVMNMMAEEMVNYDGRMDGEWIMNG